jgi:hypothetical protein
MNKGIGGVSPQRTPGTGPGSNAAEPSGQERPPEPPRPGRSNAMPLRSRMNRTRAGQDLKHSVDADAHDPADSHQGEGLSAMRPAGKFRLPGADANRLKSYQTEKFVPSLSTVPEGTEEAAAPPARRGPPPPLARPRLPTVTPTSTQASEASGPAAHVDINAGAAASARADAQRQMEMQHHLQRLSSMTELHKAAADLIEKGASSVSSGI